MTSSSQTEFYKIVFGIWGNEQPDTRKFEFQPKNSSVFNSISYHQSLKVILCSEESESSLECVSNLIQNNPLYKCSEKCLTPTIKAFMPKMKNNQVFKNCSNFEQEICMESEHFDFFLMISEHMKRNCSKPCLYIDYRVSTSEINLEQYASYEEYILLQIYSSFGTIKVKKEYRIYDTLGMIGTCGGSFGLFTGFSFFDVICHFIDHIALRLKLK